jgi:antitoxin FitA
MPSITTQRVRGKYIVRSVRGPPDAERSTESETREILAAAVKPEGRVKLRSLLADIGGKARLTDEEFAIFDVCATRHRHGGWA